MKPLDLISIASIRETVRAIDPDDDDLLLGMMEGETDVGELLDELLEIEADTFAYIDANKERIKVLQSRNARLNQRTDAMRAGMHKLLDAAGLRKMERAAATVSIRAVPPKVLGDDITSLPEGLVKVSYAPDKVAIKAWLAQPGNAAPLGWSMSNGGETLSIRRS